MRNLLGGLWANDFGQSNRLLENQWASEEIRGNRGGKRMKSILISIKPEWVAKILNGEKTIEIRKTAPKCDLPIDVYIHCTKGGEENLIRNRNGWSVSEFAATYVNGERVTHNYKGKVLAKFTLRKVEDLRGINSTDGFSILDRACLDYDEFLDYLYKGREGAYAYHISDLVIFDKPKEPSEFGVQRAPQSWQYIEVKE